MAGGWLAWVALSTALLATVAGNITAAVVSWTSVAVVLTVAAWPALAFTLVWELVTGHGGGPSKLPPPAHHTPPVQVAAPLPDVETAQVSGVESPGDRVEAPPARAAELIAAGAGRRRLVRELGVTEWEARQLIRQHGGDDREDDREGSA